MKQIQQAFSLLGGMIEGSPDPIAAQDADFRYIAFNRAYQAEFKRVFGIDLKVGDSMVQILAHLPDEQKNAMEIWGRTLRGEEFSITREYGDARQDRRTYEIRCIPLRDHAGQVIGAVHMGREVTERKRAEDQLRQSEERFRRLIETSSVGLAIADSGGRLRYANPAVLEMLGYAWEDVGRLHCMDFMAPAYASQHALAIAQVLATGVGEPYENELIAKDGRRIPVLESGSMLDNAADGQPLIAFFITDLTRLKQTEAILSLRNERLTLLSDAAAHLLKAESPETMIQELFEKVSRHLDLQAYFNFMVNEAGDALRLDSSAGIPPDVVQQVQRLEFGQDVSGTVARFRKPIYSHHIQQSSDDKVQLLKSLGIRAYTCNPLLAGGRLLGTLSFASRSRESFAKDELEFLGTICHYVAIAKERLRLEGELHRHIAQLAEADRRKDEFLAMLAHELRNPLAPIRNAVQVMRLAGAPDPVMQRQHDIIDRQVTHMGRLLDDLLEVSRITQGKIGLRLMPMALGDVLAHAAETAAPLIEARGQALEFDPPPDALRVMTDPDRLAQVVGNLLTNAAKYTPEGGRIWLEAARAGDEAVIRVRDTGVGIDPEMLSRIFDLFAQADKSLARSQGGLGIGLTMVKSLVELLGGRVEARSQGLDQGSEFVIHLPLMATGMAERAGATEWLATPERGGPEPVRRVLVVDDNQDEASSLGELLELWGHDVRTAGDGPSALCVAREWRPEVVLLDIGLPGMNGYEVAQRLRHESETAEAWMVALTGYGTDEDRRRTREAGFDQHLVKPVSLDELSRLLTRTAS